jgi:beta-phosphoglucomutase family hydrolase
MLPQAVIFDMDGVIVDTADAHCASWQQLGREFGMTITREEFLTTFGRPSDEIIRQRFGADLPDLEVRRLADRKEACFRELARDQVKLIPYADTLIKSLFASGIPLAIGSSAPKKNIELTLELFDLGKCFRAIVHGHDVARGKPDPQVFLLAAERLGVEPKGCVVIEDAPAGIAAARSAGMLAVALTTSHPATAFTAAHHVIDSLTAFHVEQLFPFDA